MGKSYATLFSFFFIVSLCSQNIDIQFVEENEKGYFTHLFTKESSIQPPF